MTPSARHILKVYRRATAEQITEGLNWYRAAHGAAVSLDPGNPRRAAGIIAALSPKTPWSRNLELAARVYSQGFASGTLGNSCAAANAILDGADPLDVLKGPKVRAFFQCIAEPDTTDAVCIDRHAIDVATGVRHTDATRPRADKGPRYDGYVSCYQRAGYRVGITGADMQAITWVAKRGTAH